MDLKSILPLILSGKSSDSQQNGATAALMNSILSNNQNGISAEMISSALSANKNQSSFPTGIFPILDIVNDQLLGKMVKYLSRK